MLVSNANTTPSNGDLFVYILDKDEKKTHIVNEVAKQINLTPFELLPKQFLIEANKNEIEKCIYPPIEQWLRSFSDAKFIITDSFHGTIFSIIFEKPFIVIGNKKRGLSRFNSLLEMFRLEERMINENDEFDFTILSKKINYGDIYAILQKKQQLSITFFKNIFT